MHTIDRHARTRAFALARHQYCTIILRGLEEGAGVEQSARLASPSSRPRVVCATERTGADARLSSSSRSSQIFPFPSMSAPPSPLQNPPNGRSSMISPTATQLSCPACSSCFNSRLATRARDRPSLELGRSRVSVLHHCQNAPFLAALGYMLGSHRAGELGARVSSFLSLSFSLTSGAHLFGSLAAVSGRLASKVASSVAVSTTMTTTGTFDIFGISLLEEGDSSAFGIKKTRNRIAWRAWRASGWACWLGLA